MSATAKRKFVRITSPLGIAVYPRLTTPDTKFDKDGVYSVDLEVDPTDKTVSAFIDTLKKASDESYKAECEKRGNKKLKRADLPIKETEDNKIRIKFKLKAKAGNEEKSWTQKPVLFDAQGTAIQTPPNVGSGSQIKVAFEVVPFFTAMVGAGVSLRLKAVQIIDLKEYTPGDNFDAYGFKADPKGFKAAATATEATTDTDEDASDF
jgi:hypothetical protein